MCVLLTEYYSDDPIRIKRLAGHVVRMGESRGVYKVFVGKPERNRPRRRWEDNIKVHIREVRWRSMDWIAVT